MDTRDPDAGSSWVFFNYNLMEEVQVGGLGANAEYGAYTGAVVNTIMKSGGNRYTGLFDAYWTRARASPPQRHDGPGGEEPVPRRAPPSSTSGWTSPARSAARIIQDKLFFFVAAQRYEQLDDPSGPLDLHTEVSPRFNAKLTWQPRTNDNVAFSFQWDYYNQTGRCTVERRPLLD